MYASDKQCIITLGQLACSQSSTLAVHVEFQPSGIDNLTHPPPIFIEHLKIIELRFINRFDVVDDETQSTHGHLELGVPLNSTLDVFGVCVVFLCLRAFSYV